MNKRIRNNLIAGSICFGIAVALGIAGIAIWPAVAVIAGCLFGMRIVVLLEQRAFEKRLEAFVDHGVPMSFKLRRVK